MENKWLKFIPKKNQWLIVLLVGILLVIIAMPTKTESDSETEMNFGTNTENANATDMERRLESLLRQMKNVGEVQVMITFQEEEKVEGVVVLAEGAGNAVVVRDITSVVQALFDVDSHKIKVIERNQNH